MNTDNPLRIFTPEQLETIDQKSLKQLKNEILLEFQLTSQSTIVLNDIEIDKNGILEIFEDLEQNLPLYLFIHKNKTLYTFLDNGETAFLIDDAAINNIKNLTEGKDEIEQKIVVRLKDMISQLIKTPTIRTPDDLNKIKRFINQLNPSLIDEAYSKAYDDLKVHLDYLQEKFETPFSNPDKKRFHPELSKHVSLNFYKMFASLPDAFQGLKVQYCNWCNNAIVYETCKTNLNLSKYSKDALIVLRNAAKIASQQVFKERNIKIARAVQNHLDNGGGRANSSSSMSPWRILLFIVLAIRVIYGFGKCSNNSSKNTYVLDQTQFNRQQDKSDNSKRYKESQARLKKILDEDQRKYNPSRKVTNKYSILDYGGEKLKALNAKLIKTTERETLSELTFNVDVLPSKITYFYKLIPSEFAEKHKGKIWPVVMIFKHPRIPNSTLEHRLLFDFKSKKKYIPQQYGYKKSEFEEDLNLSLKRISYDNYPLNGILSRVDSKTSEVLHSTRFSISYIKNKKEFVVTIKPSNKKITITKDYISKLDPKYAIEEVDKYAIAIKNINLVNNKYLKQGNIFTVKNVFGYSIEESTKKGFPGKKIIREKAYLKNKITSEEDNTSCVELKGQNTVLKYFADFSSGRIKGMTVVNSTDDLLQIERMVLFSSK